MKSEKMKTLQLILRAYHRGEISLNEMQDIVNETMEYRGFKMSYGSYSLKAIFHGELIQATL